MKEKYKDRVQIKKKQEPTKERLRTPTPTPTPEPTKIYSPVLAVLEHMSEFDPEGARIANDRLWQEAADAANVDLRTLRRALNRVVWDGMYGPVPDEEWANTSGQQMTMTFARRVLGAAMHADHTPVVYEHPDVGWMCAGSREGEGGDACTHTDHLELEDYGPLFHCEPITIPIEEIRKCMWHEILQVYGGIPEFNY